MGLLGVGYRPPAATPHPGPQPGTVVSLRAPPRTSPASPCPNLCPDAGRARLGYDRARVLFKTHTGWELHQLRHSAATHLGEKNVPLQTIMAKTRHYNPRTAMRYIRPGAQAVAEVTDSSTWAGGTN